jgi:hypothetical protein
MDRRVSVRRQPTVGTVCDLADSAERIGTGLVWNVSASGVSMLLQRRLEPGTVVDVELSAADTGFRLALPLRVAHAAQLRTGDFILGGQFARNLTADEMRPFLG